MVHQLSIYAVTMEPNPHATFENDQPCPTRLCLDQQHVRNIFNKEQEGKLDKSCRKDSKWGVSNDCN